MTADSCEATYLALLPSDTERRRYATLKRSLAPIASLIPGARMLDYGASYGLSAVPLIELGAREVVGVEPEEWRVARGLSMLRDAGYGDRVILQHTPDTTALPHADAAFDLVLCNAVLEHIPQPRTAHIREMWRLLKPGGTLFINETPNKYLPWDYHTTGLWWVPWLPSALARRYAIFRGRYAADGDWAHSGWRGLGYYELEAAIPSSFDLTEEQSRPRHRILKRLGLPASLFDPYPTHVIRKREARPGW